MVKLSTTKLDGPVVILKVFPLYPAVAETMMFPFHPFESVEEAFNRAASAQKEVDLYKGIDMILFPTAKGIPPFCTVYHNMVSAEELGVAFRFTGPTPQTVILVVEGELGDPLKAKVNFAVSSWRTVSCFPLGKYDQILKS